MYAVQQAGTGGLMLWWEGLNESLNSPVFCMKVGFMQLEKVSLQFLFKNQQKWNEML